MNDTHEVFGNGGVRIAVIGTLAILALFLFVQTASVAQSFGRSGKAATDTITVSGEGQAYLPPDLARITFTVENTAKTVAEAQAATTKQTNAAIEYAKGQEIEQKDIRTSYYNISPQYEYQGPRPCPAGSICPDYYYNGVQKIVGYRVSHAIELKVRDLDATGTVLAGLGELGIQNISGPELGLDDSSAGYNAARADAIAKAKYKAQVLADQLGVRLGRIVSFNEGGGYGGAYYSKAYDMAMEAAGSANPAPQIPVGENQYNANVSITYELR